ncbi:MAG: peptidase [Flavobacteriales bacterium]|nr:peptidase [Flavobacteriales bacterium]
MGPFIVLLVVVAGWYLYRKYPIEKKQKQPIAEVFPPKWRIILTQKVAFYNALNAEEKLRFERKVQEFLSNTRITGIDVEVDLEDRLLVAAGAVIVIFRFDNWHYATLDEVLIYPNEFNQQFETAGPSRSVMGIVGTGYMNGKMILSKEALHHGFENTTDKRNTAIHEFVHLIDKDDGWVDGIPNSLLEKQMVIPWLDLMKKEISAILEGKSDIDVYGATNQQEFFAVASEYFFDRPDLFREKHPELFAMMEKIFHTDMSDVRYGPLPSIGRNDPCPCGSGKKYKECCGKV